MMALMFFSGILALTYAKRIPYTYSTGFLSLASFLAIATLFPKLTVLCGATLLAYALFALGRSPAMSWFGRYGDFSYGIYIYSFPIQQALVATFNPASPYKFFAAALALSILAGAISWHVIESKFIKLKTRIDLEKYPLSAQPDTSW